MITLDDLARWMSVPRENERLEFKQAQTQFDQDKLAGYCCALANEGGGHLVLGVTDRRPRRVTGSAAFPDVDGTKLVLLRRLQLRVEVIELAHADGACSPSPSRAGRSECRSR